MTTDDRITRIEEEQVYGLHHNGNLVYIGATTLPLKRRRNLHFCAARCGQELDIAEYLRSVDDLRDEIEIEELPYDTEAEAVEVLGDENVLTDPDSAVGATYTGYDWTPEELEVLKELGPEHASDELDASPTECRNAALKLGWVDEKSSHLSDRQVVAIWVRYHLFEEATHESVAEHFATNSTTVGRILREEYYADVDKPEPSAIKAHAALSEQVVLHPDTVSSKHSVTPNK